MSLLDKLQEGISLVQTVRKQPPTSRDGFYESEINPSPAHSGILADILSQFRRGPEDITLIKDLLKTEMSKGLVDDKLYVTEHLVRLLASLPATSESTPKLNGELINTLWSSLTHPPVSLLGPAQYRTADGSNNNPNDPVLGKSYRSYAKSVPALLPTPVAKPEADDLFSTLFARDGDFKEHPNQISSTLFYMATLIIHDLFITGGGDHVVNQTTGYLDLSPLYGATKERQDLVRSKEDGKLWPDVFAELRILGFPPGVGALLVCFNRFHNYVVEQLAIINDGDRFTKPDTPERTKYESQDGFDRAVKSYSAALAERDELLFQTGRLITSGLYVNIILQDYVSNSILGLNQTKSTYVLDPRSVFPTELGMADTPRATGNQSSVEFNFVYRWHTSISQRDEKWTDDFYAKLFPQLDPATVTVEEFQKALYEWAHKDMGPVIDKPTEWTFGGLERDANGGFDSAALNELITSGTEDVAGAFGTHNIPNVLRVVTMLGIEQGRRWNMATLNEVRKFFSLEPHKSFHDINSDPQVARQLEAFYGHPDFVELYPGLIAEEAKLPMAPGQGLCPGYTVSRAILSDAVTIIRGDRFYTADYTLANLTAWGMNEITANPGVAQGGVIYKLLMRAFPGFYQDNSIYAMYPFTIPSKSAEIKKRLGTYDDFSWTRPSPIPQPQAFFSWAAVTKILGDQSTFNVPWGLHIFDITKHDYMLSGDTPKETEQRHFVQAAINAPSRGLGEIGTFYEDLTKRLLEEESTKLAKYYIVDACDTIANPAHAIFMAEMFSIPLKTEATPMGIVTPQELYLALAALFAWVFTDLDPATSLLLRNAAAQAGALLGGIVKLTVVAVKAGTLGFMLNGRNMADGQPKLADYGVHMISRLAQGGKSVDEITWVIVSTMAAGPALMGTLTTQILDLFLDEPYSQHWPHIQQLAREDTPEAFELLKRYCLEAARLAPASAGLLRNAAGATSIEDNGTAVSVAAGASIFTSFDAAGRDPAVFPSPDEILLDRDPKLYVHHGWGPHACLGREITTRAMAAQLRCFARLKNLRRAPGLQGRLKFNVVNGVKVYMRKDWSSWWPFPTTLKLVHDGFEGETAQVNGY